MRCIHLLDTDGFAGTERHVLALVRELRAQGVDASIGCRGGAKLHRAAEDEGLPVLNLGPRPGPRMLLNLLREVGRDRPELIHAHNGRTQLMGAIVHRLTGVPLFATQHFLEPRFTTYRGAKRVLANASHAWVNRHVVRFAAVSDAARSAMLVRERVCPEQIVTIRNGIEGLAAVPADRLNDIRAGLNVAAGTPMVVTVARLAPEKGVADLIDAVPIVRRFIPDVVFVIVGDGDLGDSLAARARQLGIASCVRFAGFRADATDIIAAADLFVLPSPAEPFGLVLLEAMALGKPVIAMAAGGPLEIVADGRTGRLVPPADPAALAEAIIAALRNPLLAEMGAAGLERFQQHFTADRMAAATAAMYADGLVAADRGNAALA